MKLKKKIFFTFYFKGPFPREGQQDPDLINAG